MPLSSSMICCSCASEMTCTSTTTANCLASSWRTARMPWRNTNVLRSNWSKSCIHPFFRHKSQQERDVHRWPQWSRSCCPRLRRWRRCLAGGTIAAAAAAAAAAAVVVAFVVVAAESAAVPSAAAATSCRARTGAPSSPETQPIGTMWTIALVQRPRRRFRACFQVWRGLKIGNPRFFFFN